MKTREPCGRGRAILSISHDQMQENRGRFACTESQHAGERRKNGVKKRNARPGPCKLFCKPSPNEKSKNDGHSACAAIRHAEKRQNPNSRRCICIFFVYFSLKFRELAFTKNSRYVTINRLMPRSWLWDTAGSPAGSFSAQCSDRRQWQSNRKGSVFP